MGLRLRCEVYAPLADEARQYFWCMRRITVAITSILRRVDREPYMAPGLVTEEKASRGKLPTDVWWHTIVSPTGKEKTGYPTQKPTGLLRRMIAASSRPGDWVLDFFAGSGSTGAAAAQLGRKFVCVDQNPPAIEVMAKRLGVDPVSFAEYRGVPRGASVLFTPKRTVGVRGGTSRDALTAASVMR